MKKGKVFSKRHIVTAVLAICLIAAVWLNMRFSSFGYVSTASSSSSTSEQSFYDTNSALGEAVQTGTGIDQISSARKERDDKRNKAVGEFKDIINNSTVGEDEKSNALASLGLITSYIIKESDIETLIKSKGFSDVMVMISEESVSIIVPSEGLLASETLQIQDAVRSQISVDLEKIKIITVK
ncbi:MAG: SpoIIIAH-like family protein [Clostridia bacterium]|nr:SpoIIIAH-like family protein [Clostridia bacterium]